MHIRRALLLFAIVLGMAALAASLSRPAEQRSSSPPPEQTTTAPPTATAEPLAPDNPPVVVSFDAMTDERQRVPVDRAATIEVSVEEPGSVELPGLGLTAAADPHTPARFDLFPRRADDYEILFTPAQGDESRAAGTLVVN